MSDVKAIADSLTAAQEASLRSCVMLTAAGHGCGASNRVIERLGLVRVTRGSAGGRCHVPTQLGRDVYAELEQRKAKEGAA